MDPADTELVALALGDGHGCVVARSGAVWCWGRNELYQVAFSNSSLHNEPILSTRLTGPGVISAGWGRTCAVDAGEVACWGAGIGRTVPGEPPLPAVPTPTRRPGVSGAVAVAVASESDCALAHGEVHCWPAKGDAIRVDRLTDAVAMGAAGERGCALRSSGEVLCFDPARGLLEPEPRATEMVALAVAHMRACGITRAGEVSCWFTTPGFAAWPIRGLSGAKALAVQNWSACALLDSGEVQCWTMGERSLPPARVEGLSGHVTAIAASNSSAGNGYCAVADGRSVRCWEVGETVGVASALPGFPL